MQTPDPKTKAETPPTVGNAIAELLAANARMMEELTAVQAEPDALVALARLERATIANVQNITALVVLFQENAIALDEQFTMYNEVINTHAAEMMDHRERLTKLENPKRIITLG